MDDGQGRKPNRNSSDCDTGDHTRSIEPPRYAVKTMHGYVSIGSPKAKRGAFYVAITHDQVYYCSKLEAEKIATSIRSAEQDGVSIIEVAANGGVAW
jgi:hypothetical protein